MTTEAGIEPAASHRGTSWKSAIAVGLAIGAAVYAYENWDTVSTQYLGFPYTCENMVTELASLPPANAFLPRLAGIVERTQVSSTPERVECSGVGIYANGARVPVRYRAWREGGQWWIQYEPAV